MAILLFPSRIPQSSSARQPPATVFPSEPDGQSNYRVEEIKASPTHNLDIPPHHLKITLTFTQLLFLPPQ